MKFSFLDIAMFIYGGLVLVGGVAGYFAAGSMMSLVVAVIAEVCITAGVLIAQKRPAVGYSICSMVAVALIAFFAYRIAVTGKPMPALGVIILSLIALSLLIAGHRKRVGAP